MKRIYLCFLVLCALFAEQALAQTFINRGIWTPENPLHERSERDEHSAIRTPVICGIDTSDYAIFKAADSAGVLVDIFDISTNGLVRLAQWYDAPSPVTIWGMDFIITSPSAVDITVSIFEAGADSTPTGNALATFTGPVSADTNLVNYQLSLGSPVTVTGPYVLTIENDNPQVVGVACSEWTEQEGRQEWLASAGAGSFWLRGYDVTVDNEVFDADVLLLPHVSYEYDLSFGANPDDCFAFGNPISFTSNITPIYFSRFYNRVFNPLSSFFNPDTAFIWFFGDGDSSFMANPTHTYQMASPMPDSFEVLLSGRMFGYRGICPISDTTLKVPAGLPANIDITATPGAVDGEFEFDLTGDADTWYWNFGDGSPLVNDDATPTHTYASVGTFTVLAIAESCNTQDTATVMVEYSETTTNISSITSGVQIGPNPTSGMVRLTAQTEWGLTKLSLLDVQGRSVWQQQRYLAAGESQTIDVSHVAAGWYWLNVEGNSAQTGMRLRIK